MSISPMVNCCKRSGSQWVFYGFYPMWIAARGLAGRRFCCKHLLRVLTERSWYWTVRARAKWNHSITMRFESVDLCRDWSTCTPVKYIPMATWPAPTASSIVGLSLRSQTLVCTIWGTDETWKKMAVTATIVVCVQCFSVDWYFSHAFTL